MKMAIVGVTGGFGSGKSIVAGMFKGLGASLIDADKIYHHLLMPKQPLYSQVLSCFGDKIIGEANQIDRKKLARIVFANKKLLKRLCQITHPQIIKEIKTKLARLKSRGSSRVVVIDTPLLIEAGLQDLVDILIVVTASQQRQIQRSRLRERIGRSGIIQRIKAQLPLIAKIRLADYVIDNNGTVAQTRRQVKHVWSKIIAEKEACSRWKSPI